MDSPRPHELAQRLFSLVLVLSVQWHFQTCYEKISFATASSWSYKHLRITLFPYWPCSYKLGCHRYLLFLQRVPTLQFNLSPKVLGHLHIYYTHWKERASYWRHCKKSATFLIILTVPQLVNEHISTHNSLSILIAIFHFNKVINTLLSPHVIFECLNLYSITSKVILIAQSFYVTHSH